MAIDRKYVAGQVWRGGLKEREIVSRDKWDIEYIVDGEKRKVVIASFINWGLKHEAKLII